MIWEIVYPENRTRVYEAFTLCIRCDRGLYYICKSDYADIGPMRAELGQTSGCSLGSVNGGTGECDWKFKPRIDHGEVWLRENIFGDHIEFQRESSQGDVPSGFLAGIARDYQELKNLANLQVDYLITIKPQLVKFIRKLGMQPVLCLFLINTDALGIGLRSIGDVVPDAVIVMSSSLPKRAVLKIKKKKLVPVIGGGVAFDVETIQIVRKKGFHSIATCKENLWKQ